MRKPKKSHSEKYAGLLAACMIFMPGTGRFLAQDGTESVVVKGADLKPLSFRAEIHVLPSAILKEELKIHVSFPVDYQRSESAYPVLICTDADRNFGLLSDVVHILSFPAREMPRVLVVGIGYSTEGLEDWVAKRHRDFSPTSDPGQDRKLKEQLSAMSGRSDLDVTSGGAPLFLDFIRHELIPFVESRYRVDSKDRAIMGYSHGGLFVLYALFHSPGTFRRVYAGSPSIWWDDTVLFRYENEYASTHGDLPVRLFMSAGGAEAEPMLENINRLSEKLRSRNYPGLELETDIFENETHSSCYAPGINRALRVIYRR